MLLTRTHTIASPYKLCSDPYHARVELPHRLSPPGPFIPVGLQVLELGSGNGLCALSAARLGAHVLATDHRRLPLELLSKASEACEAPLRCALLDFARPLPRPLLLATKQPCVPKAEAELPAHELLLAADVGYSKARRQVDDLTKRC